MIITRCIKFNKKLINFSYTVWFCICKSHFQVCMKIMEWNINLWKLFVDSWLESWVMASIGSEDEWNILHDTHTKLVYYCWEPLTIEYPGKFFYPPLTFLIKKRKLCSQYFHNTFTINSNRQVITNCYWW